MKIQINKKLIFYNFIKGGNTKQAVDQALSGIDFSQGVLGVNKI